MGSLADSLPLAQVVKCSRQGGPAWLRELVMSGHHLQERKIRVDTPFQLQREGRLSSPGANHIPGFELEAGEICSSFEGAIVL